VIQATAVNSVGSVPSTPSFVVPGSYNPQATTPISISASGPPIMALRPTSPASLGDLSRNTQEDSGHVLGPSSGSIDLFATAIDQPTGQTAAISFINVYALVSTRDDVPVGTYVPCTAPEFFIRVSGGARTTYGITSGVVPADMGDFENPVWVREGITTRPGGGAWRWSDIASIDELGIAANYTLGIGDFTNLRLDEVWVEVYGQQGSIATPIVIRSRAGSPIRKTFTQVVSSLIVLSVRSA
jgi:hypothetical protein